MHGDGLEVIAQNAHRKEAVFFIDPPYTAGGKRAGSRLYLHSEVDHPALFNIAGQIAGDFLVVSQILCKKPISLRATNNLHNFRQTADFLMTYDDAAEVRALAQQHGLDFQTVPMKNTHHQWIQI